METCLVIIALVAVAILLIVVAGLQAIASICKHGGVTIHIIQDSLPDTTVSEPVQEMSAEEKAALDKYNEEQMSFLGSIRNLQKLFIGEDQMAKEDKK